MAKEDGSTPLTTKKSSVERLKGRLYARDGIKRKSAQDRTPLSPEAPEAPVSWTPQEPARDRLSPNLIMSPRRPRMSFATKFLIGSAFFFLVATMAAAYMFFGGGNIVSSRNIDLEVVAPSLIDGGKESQIQIIISNHNRTSLQLADLIIDYPEGTRDPQDPTRALSHERISVGTIQSGQQLKQTASAVFFGGEGTQQNIHVTLEYTVKGSNAVFVKDSEVTFLIGSSPVSLSVDAPSEAIAGEPFDITVTVQSNAPAPVEHVVVEGQYPFGFTFINSEPSADVGGLLWRLGTLQPGSKKIIHLTGMVDASAGDERVLRFLVGADPDETNTRIRVPFLTEPVTLSVQKPFIAGSISVDGKTAKSISAPAGKTLQGSVTWQNNLSEAVSDIEMVLSFEGAPLDLSSISAQSGFYQSKERSIIWTKAQDPSLAQVSPSGGGTLSFSFATLPPGSGGTLYTNPTVDLNLTIKGTRQSEGSVPQNVAFAASTQVTLASNISLEAKALHFSGAFSNFGPMPPRAESQTSYTILWTVKNSSNAVANATVVTILPPYVKFASAAPGSGITYDEASRTARWSLGDVAAGVGYSGAARTGAFQIVFTPSTSQIGESPALTGSALLTGQDRFAQIPVEARADAPTIELSGDSGYNSSMGEVQDK